jgi:hypothetical protein
MGLDTETDGPTRRLLQHYFDFDFNFKTEQHGSTQLSVFSRSAVEIVGVHVHTCVYYYESS